MLERSKKQIIRSAVADLEYALEYSHSRNGLRNELEKRGWTFIGHPSLSNTKVSKDEEIYMEDQDIPNCHALLFLNFVNASYRVFTLKQDGRFDMGPRVT